MEGGREPRNRHVIIGFRSPSYSSVFRATAARRDAQHAGIARGDAAAAEIPELADDIAARTLLQSLNVRAMLDDAGKETGRYEVPAGGRRFRALELLVAGRRMAKDQPVPCVVRVGGNAVEDSYSENFQREPLNPLYQFRAFKERREAGLSEEDIAARFMVGVAVVRQRLRLAAGERLMS